MNEFKSLKSVLFGTNINDSVKSLGVIPHLREQIVINTKYVESSNVPNNQPGASTGNLGETESCEGPDFDNGNRVVKY